VREIVIVISDLFLARDESGGRGGSRAGAGDDRAVSNRAASDDGESLPSVSYMARFGQKSAVPQGWRPWLARWSGRDDLVRVAPAAIAGAATRRTSLEEGSGEKLAGSIWFATPVHLIAGLTNLHLDRRSVLRLPEHELAQLTDDFARVFGDSEFSMEPTSYGILLMRARSAIEAATTEPARAAVGDLQTSLPTGPNGAVLRRLGAELEMWLHGHPINQQRSTRGELPLSTLWLWGGGPSQNIQSARAPSRQSDVGFGSDPYFMGLWHIEGSERLALPERLPNFSSHPRAQRMALILEAISVLHANPQWTMFEALADLDRRFISPALAMLRSGEVSTVILLANDIELRIGRRDHLRFWRRAPSSGLDALHFD
jgi:hypothetical protein